MATQVDYDDKPVEVMLYPSIIFMVIGMLVGVFIAFNTFIFADYYAGQYIHFGVVRPVHVGHVTLLWLLSIDIALFYYFVPRLCGTPPRAELIRQGEHIYAVEGCWFCHTDQTRTLVQDVVLNGSADYPAPPSCASEYIYQHITFPGTRRIGPDISRVGVKRPSRDWHKGHFGAPKTASKGSIMPAFQHFLITILEELQAEVLGYLMQNLRRSISI